MFKITCNMLQESGLPFDWRILQFAYHGFGQHKMSADEVIACALDRIGHGTEEQDRIAALLANTDPQDWQTIARYLEELAGQEPIDRITSLRRLRYAELKRLLSAASSGDDTWEAEDAVSLTYNLIDFWMSYVELPDSASMIPEYASPTGDILRRHRQWLNYEGSELGAISND